MKQQIREYSEILTLVRTTDDILRAKKENKTGIIFGFQNAHAFEDNLGYIEAFKELGVNVVQLCYNTQNLVGTGCYEARRRPVGLRPRSDSGDEPRRHHGRPVARGREDVVGRDRLLEEAGDVIRTAARRA